MTPPRILLDENPMAFEEAKADEPQLFFQNEPTCPRSPGGSSNASFAVAENVACAEEVFVSLRGLLEELNATEQQLLKEEKSYESQIRRQKEVYEDLMKNYNSTI